MISFCVQHWAWNGGRGAGNGYITWYDTVDWVLGMHIWGVALLVSTISLRKYLLEKLK